MKIKAVVKCSMPKKHIQHILITGSSGQLGQELRVLSEQYQNNRFSFLSRSNLDISNRKSLKNYFTSNRVDIVVNCAAFTAVERAESETSLAEKINYHATRKLAKISHEHGTILIHISTDYVFSGNSLAPYDEDSICDPKTVYGLSKLKGEQAIMTINPKGLIIRTSWLYSPFGRNFVRTIFQISKQQNQISVVNDQTGSPTYARDLALAIMDIIHCENFLEITKQQSLFHYSNEGSCTWFDLALAIVDIKGLECNIEPIETEDLNSPVNRPLNSVLDTSKIKKTFNVKTPYWKDSLIDCLGNMEK